jgi:hypothetical protein
MHFRFVLKFHKFSKKCIFHKRKCLWRSNSTQNHNISVRSKVSQREILRNIFLQKNTLLAKENFLIISIVSNVMVFRIEKFSKILKKNLQKTLSSQNKVSLEVQFYTKSCIFGSFKSFTKKFYQIFFFKITSTQNKMSEEVRLYAKSCNFGFKTFHKDKFSKILKTNLQKMLFSQNKMHLEVEFYTKS